MRPIMTTLPTSTPRWRTLLECLGIATLLIVGATTAWTQEIHDQHGKLVPGDAGLGDVQDWFGFSVAIDGDTAVVGAPLRDDVASSAGAAYVFVRDAGDERGWIQVAKLTASDTRLGLQFGRSVSISGDTVIVGAVGDNEQGEFTGAAYIFERHRGGENAWGEVKKLRATGAARGDVFGYSVSISGDTAIVGAPQDQAPFPARAGFVHVFERNHPDIGEWGEVARLTASDGASRHQFGHSVAISGNTIIVGALGGGAAYIFERHHGGSGPPFWSQTARLPVAGFAVSISGDTAIVGTGSSASIFSREPDGGEWMQVASPNPFSGMTRPGDRGFGRSVSVSGDLAVIGAYHDDEKGGLDSFSGSAFVFRRDEGGEHAWGQVVKLTASDGVRGDQLGTSVAVSGSTAVLGAPTFGGEPGSAYVCPLETVNSENGACRRAVPILNHVISMSDLTTTCCARSELTITATFTNTSAGTIRDVFFEVIQLTGGNLLLNADGGPGGVGATLTPALWDGTLGPGEAVTVAFVIGLQSRIPFGFQVNVRGEPEPRD
jgi:hypothetical protein